ncbi:hypothetical protein WJX79_001432 [Trebouxia sp. C0005]
MTEPIKQPIKYQGVDKQSSGYKLLAAMGWQEGSGLGARQQGIKEHVKVKKKHDSTGVGAVEAIAKARDWTAGMAAYDLVLAKMKSVGAASLPAKLSSKPQSPSQINQSARKTRKGRRYHKTTAAKKAGAYSKSDLAAILGVDSFPTAAPVSVTAAAQSSEEQESSEDTTFEPQDVAAGSSVNRSEGQSAQPVDVEEEAWEPQDGSLWWHGMFIRAGRMGNMASDVRSAGQEQGKKVQVNGFSEQDQENLYMATQAGKSAGKKGLGKSSQGKPIGGAKWEGTKTAFNGDEDTTDAAAAATAAEPAAAPLAGVADTDVCEAAEALSGGK